MAIYKAFSKSRCEFGATDTQEMVNLLGQGNALNCTTNLTSLCTIDDSKKYDGNDPMILAVLNQYFGDNMPYIEIKHNIPKEAGLAGSSARACSLIKAVYEFFGEKADPKKLALEAYDLERNVLGHPGGSQDQFSCAYEGLNYYIFKPDLSESVVYPIHSPILRDISDMLIGFFIPRTTSGLDIHADMKSKPMNIEILKKKYNCIEEEKDALESGNIIKFETNLNKLWNLKKQQNPNRYTPFIERIHDDVMGSRRATASRLIGAGGGGTLIFLSEDPKHLRSYVMKNYLVEPIDFVLEE